MLFCAWVRFNSDPFKECSNEAIWGVMQISGVESVQERRREAAGEQSVDDVCDWFGTAQGMDCGNDKKLAIIVC